MSHHDSHLSPNMPKPDPETLTKLTKSAERMGYEIVDVSGYVDLVQSQAQEQSEAVRDLRVHTRTVDTTSARVAKVSTDLSKAADRVRTSVVDTVDRVRKTDQSAQSIASWVRDLTGRTDAVGSTLDAVRKNNQQIVSIARQVNTLAINAKIEAARAGDAGRGFSVVADAINTLSQQTGTAAVQISDNVDALTKWILALAEEAGEVSSTAASILEKAAKTDESLKEMESSIQANHARATDIVKETERMRVALQAFAPSLEGIEVAVTATTKGIDQARNRIYSLVDTSEAIVQQTAAMGTAGANAKFVTHVQSAAAEISALFDHAVAEQMISKDAMFDRTYTPIAGTDPTQVMAPYTALTDKLLPSIQEKALSLDKRVVFCAAVDTNGYLPTHNEKFSQPQSSDPVWNTGHCRNRRIFDDRVGLKAGRNMQPFLVQVYRRDMGGGEFAMMKDISAPIFVGGKHWGGLRLAVTF